MPLNKGSIREYLEIFKESLLAFSEDNAMKKGAALAYYTIFSLAPLLLIIIWLIGFFYGEQASRGQVFGELNELVGAEAAKLIQELIKNASLAGKSSFAILVGVGTLIVGATKVFIEIQDSINEIWGVRAKPKKGWLKIIIDRVLSFSVIIGLGFLLIVSLFINLLIDALSELLMNIVPYKTVFLFNLANSALSFVVIAIIFSVIFKFLPDAIVHWKYVRTGAIFTTLLFVFGKYIIGLYMQYSAPASAYGAAGSIIVLMLWVYYTSAILFFGAEFTKVYAKRKKGEIIPAKYAVRIIKAEVEQEVDTEKEKD